MTEKEAIVFLDAIKRGLHQTGKDHPYRDDLIPKMKEALCIAIEEMKAESCKDAISRKSVDALVDELARAISDERLRIPRGRSTGEIMQDIIDLPSVIPRLKTGKWNVLGRDDLEFDLYRCSECHAKITLKFNYCPCCGAKMEDPE